MPWCEQCATFQQNATLTGEGACPSCGTVLGPPPKAPWHFKLLVVALVIYLGWRAWQGVVWIVHRF